MFTGELDIRILPNGDRILLTPSVWAEEFESLNARTFTAPAGLVHDGNSTPSLLAFMTSAALELPAAIHDAAYQAQHWDNGEEMTRWEADWMMRCCAGIAQRRIRESVPGYRRWALTVWHGMQRWAMWSGVRCGGWVFWGKHKRARELKEM